MYGSFWVALPDVQELSVDSQGCPGVVGRTSQMFDSGRKTLLAAWE